MRSKAVLFLIVLLTTEAPAQDIIVDSAGALPLVKVVRDGTEFPLWDPDPQASFWIAEVDGVQIIPAESNWLRDDAEDLTRYTVPAYAMEQYYSLSSAGDQLLLTMNFINNSTQRINFAPLLLMDTLLGELGGQHFVLPDGQTITAESAFDGMDLPQWFESSDSRLSLKFTLYADWFEKPESLTFANWFRLKQDGPDFRVSPGRSFDHVPLSVNDSAVLIRYRTRILAPGESAQVSLIIGPGGEISGSRNETAETVLAEPDRRNLLMERIREINSVIDAIDKLQDAEISSSDLTAIEHQTAELERLRTEYESLQ